MSLIENLRAKKINVIENPKWGNYLRKLWENNFVNHLSKEDKKAINLYDDKIGCGFLWHVFSYEKKECLKGEAAENAFNDMFKNNCYLFYQHSENVIILADAEKLDSNDWNSESDIYVVDKDFTWTFVQTHEKGWCGPYFCEKIYELFSNLS